jgi:hypothetical protein
VSGIVTWKMGRYLGGLVLLGAMFALAARAETPFWLKAWTVAEVDSAPADRATFARAIGMQIVMEADRLVDPLAEDCTQDLSYSDIQPRPVAEMGTHFGTFWKWPTFSKSTATYGWIRCAGSNVGAFAFVDSGRAYLFYEGGAVLRLK